MFLWMSTGLPFNATFDLMNVPADGEAASQPQDAVVMTSEQPAPLLRRHGSARQRYVQAAYTLKNLYFFCELIGWVFRPDR